MGPTTLHALRPGPTPKKEAHGPPGPATPPPPASRIVVPVRYSAWMNGDLGLALQRRLAKALASRIPAKVSRMPRGFLVEAHEAPGPLLELVHRASLELEAGVEQAFPVLHHEMGPVWTGTLQAVFD